MSDEPNHPYDLKPRGGMEAAARRLRTMGAAGGVTLVLLPAGTKIEPSGPSGPWR